MPKWPELPTTTWTRIWTWTRNRLNQTDNYTNYWRRSSEPNYN